MSPNYTKRTIKDGIIQASKMFGLSEHEESLLKERLFASNTFMFSWRQICWHCEKLVDARIATREMRENGFPVRIAKRWAVPVALIGGEEFVPQAVELLAPITIEFQDGKLIHFRKDRRGHMISEEVAA